MGRAIVIKIPNTEIIMMGMTCSFWEERTHIYNDRTLRKTVMHKIAQ